jgi:hypothetical protein
VVPGIWPEPEFQHLLLRQQPGLHGDHCQFDFCLCSKGQFRRVGLGWRRWWWRIFRRRVWWRWRRSVLGNCQHRKKQNLTTEARRHGEKQGGLPRSPKLPRLPRLKNQEPEILQRLALGRILENSQGIYLTHSPHAKHTRVAFLKPPLARNMNDQINLARYGRAIALGGDVRESANS